ncbi:MAG: hypothetical protein NWE95_02380 [Candidatus Bathyarchaeota archaeon]|nr:hypothetical protein [Candidatus Bathyarchaeota archaeon]
MHKSKTTAQSITALVMLALIAVAVQPQLASANYYPPPSIEIFSPITPAVYNESSVRLYVRVNALPSESSSIKRISYSLDGKANVTLTNIEKTEEAYWTSTKGVIARGNGFSVNTTLDNLSEGKHTLIVYSHAVDGTEMSRSVEFTVDFDYVPPENPFGLPDNFPNGTTGLPPATSQTATPLPTTNTGILPLENPVPYIIIAYALAALVASVLFFQTSKRRIKVKCGLPKEQSCHFHF